MKTPRASASFKDPTPWDRRTVWQHLKPGVDVRVACGLERHWKGQHVEHLCDVISWWQFGKAVFHIVPRRWQGISAVGVYAALVLPLCLETHMSLLGDKPAYHLLLTLDLLSSFCF